MAPHGPVNGDSLGMRVLFEFMAQPIQETDPFTGGHTRTRVHCQTPGTIAAVVNTQRSCDTYRGVDAGRCLCDATAQGSTAHPSPCIDADIACGCSVWRCV